MGDWEFLRRPARASAGEKAEPLVRVLVLFGGTEKEYALQGSSTLEALCEDYERRFSAQLVLEHRGAPVSRYTKAKALCESPPASGRAESAQVTLELRLRPGPALAGPKSAPASYTVRYDRHRTVEVQRGKEKTVQELQDSIAAEIARTGRTPPQGALYFDGERLSPSESIDSVLMEGDLIDFA